jgi:hypothetical protein
MDLKKYDMRMWTGFTSGMGPVQERVVTEMNREVS